MAIGIISYFLMPDRPETCKWLSDDERGAPALPRFRPARRPLLTHDTPAALAEVRIKSENVGQAQAVDKLRRSAVLQGILAPTTLGTSSPPFPPSPRHVSAGSSRTELRLRGPELEPRADAAAWKQSSAASSSLTTSPCRASASCASLLRSRRPRTRADQLAPPLVGLLRFDSLVRPHPSLRPSRAELIFLLAQPTIVKTIYPTETTVKLQLRTVPPYVIGAFVVLLTGYLSFKTKKRALYLLICAPFVTVGYILYLSSMQPQIRYAAVRPFHLSTSSPSSLPLVLSRSAPAATDQN